MPINVIMFFFFSDTQTYTRTCVHVDVANESYIAHMRALYSTLRIDMTMRALKVETNVSASAIYIYIMETNVSASAMYIMETNESAI